MRFLSSRSSCSVEDEDEAAFLPFFLKMGARPASLAGGGGSGRARVSTTLVSSGLVEERMSQEQLGLCGLPEQYSLGESVRMVQEMHQPTASRLMRASPETAHRRSATTS